MYQYDKRQKRKAKEALNIKVQQNPVNADFVCQTCGRACKSRIGLHSHFRKPTHSNTDIIKIDEFTTNSTTTYICSLSSS